MSPTAFRSAKSDSSLVSIAKDAPQGVTMSGGSINAGGVVAQLGSNRSDKGGAGIPIDADENKLKLDRIVLKFATIAEGVDQQSYVVGRDGASIGRGQCNSICIRNDTCMSESKHATIEWRDGSFYLLDQGHPYGAAIRIGMGLRRWEWPLYVGAMFSTGNSVFQVSDFDDEGCLMLDVLSGPLKGERRRVTKEGASLGRSTENNIAIPDRELSRKHSKIQWLPDGDGVMHPDSSRLHNSVNCDEGRGRGSTRLEGGGFYLTDVGSTNGTYMQPVGPYSSNRRLRLSDHILIGRTGFSINRYDWGIWEDRGVRRTMEDKSVVIQDMGIRELDCVGLAPQTYMAVYDGHGGYEASDYLWQHLHVNIAEALGRAAPRIVAAARQAEEGGGR